MVFADLHVHTTNSDGTLTLETTTNSDGELKVKTVPDAAREAGVEVVAITDHDRIHPALSDPVTTVDGIEVIHGIELRVEHSEMRVDLLGYGVERTAELDALVERLQTNRIERAREIIRRVESHTGVELDITVEAGIGRPHIARAIEKSDHHYGYQDAFDHLIGNDGPCYVSRNIPSFEEGHRILVESCAIVGLAHPLRYPDPGRALSLAEHLDAVELHYPYSRSVDTTPVERAIADHDLLVTGGSDAHEQTLGKAGLDRDEFAAIRDHLPDQ